MRDYPTPYLADKRYLKLHDLRHEQEICAIETILECHVDEPYPTIEVAMALGCCLCPYCHESTFAGVQTCG